jgi:hypothetical protein
MKVTGSKHENFVRITVPVLGIRPGTAQTSVENTSAVM